MKNEKLFDAIGQINDAYIDEAKPADDIRHQKNAPERWGRKTAAILIAAVMVTLLLITAAAAAMGINILDMIMGAFTNKEDIAVVQEQLEKGAWAYLNGDNIAVIVPESPVKILLSDNSGETWRESIVTGSDTGFHFGELREDFQYTSGYIGFSDDKNGYLVLTTPPALGSQESRIFLTEDSGYAWGEIDNLNGIHSGIITGAGFSSEKVGFVGYRYYSDEGPDIWRTTDSGRTWERMELELPEEYRGYQYKFTPLSPTFEGNKGVYPIEVTYQSSSDSMISTIYMYTDDGGLSWSF